MGLIAKNKVGAQFAPAPAGAHVARCCWVIDLGTQRSERFQKDQEKVLLGWELPEELITEGDRVGEPYFISQRYTLSLNEKATLRQHLESWRGKAFTEAELDAFDLRNVLDKACTLGITHKTNGEKTYANVSSVSPLMKGMTARPRINPLLLYDLAKPDAGVFAKMPEWLQKLVSESREAKGQSVPQQEDPPTHSDDDEPADDSDCPF